MTNLTEIKRIIRECHELHAQKFRNLDKMNEFLARQKLPKITEGEMGNPNSFRLDW